MDKATKIEIEKVSQIFKLLGDVTRLNIVLTLEEGEQNVTKIAEAVQMEQSAVSHQLKLLRENHVVKARREGRTMLYSLDDEHVLNILEQTFRHIHHR